MVPEYLRTPEADESGVRDYMDYGLQLGRRFRALKLWMVIRSFGLEGLRRRIREHIRLAAMLAGLVDSDPRFERLAPVPLGVVCFRYRPEGVGEGELERLNVALLDAVNASGDVFISHTRLDGRYTLRVQISHLRTTEEHIMRAWEILSRAVDELLPDRPTQPA
ncbi:MAG: hypothetical protein GEU28_04255 [Dehalococcoidia bacterium]|nr:hypothetical protein [Dehalococcoidia bacterium]